MDGVLICGCHPEDCRPINGSCAAARRFPLLWTVLAQFGVEPESVRLEWLSAREGPRYARLLDQIARQDDPLGWAPFDGQPLASHVERSHGHAAR